MPILIRKAQRPLSSAARAGLQVAFRRYAATLSAEALALPAEDLIRYFHLKLPWTAARRALLREVERIILDDMNRASAGAVDAIRLPEDAKARAKVFALDNPYATRWAGENAAALVQEVQASTMDALRVTIRDGFARHETIDKVARRIRGWTDAEGKTHPGIVGLHSRDAGAVSRYAAQLQEAGHSDDEINRRASRYAGRLLRNRGDNIARTEAVRSQAQGQRATWLEVVDRGVMPPGPVRAWFTAWDERTCPVCAPLHKARAPLDGPFDGGLMDPPAHPRCRCVVRIMFETKATKLPDGPGATATARQIETNREFERERAQRFAQQWRPL